MKTSIFILFLSICIASCNSDQRNIEPWKTSNYIDSVQILLTNQYKIDESFSFRASSFLIKSKNDTLLCTAKHLLGEAMGISPEIKTVEYNSQLDYWKAYPRRNTISNDTIFTTKLITEKQNYIDIILQECIPGKKNDIIVLKPRFSEPKSTERFEIIGCEYSDTPCHQRKYFATMAGYEDGKILLKSDANFTPSGFSGAPVIDSKGYVIGLLSGGGEFEGNLYLSIEPILKVEAYLQ